MSTRALKSQIEQIEAELRGLGLLTGPLQEAQAVRSAFGLDEMPFEDWLTKVFLPRAYEAAETSRWPPKSQVGTVAIKNFDGCDRYQTLVSLLCEFDQMIYSQSEGTGDAS